MKNSLTNPVRYGKIIAVEAILLTVAIHFAFLWLFSVPEVEHERAEKTNTSVTLLRFGQNNAESAKMREYIQNYSPANFSSAKSSHGFGNYIKPSSRQLPIIRDLSSNDLKIVLNKPTTEYNDIPEHKTNSIPLPPRGLAHIAPNSGRRINYPFAVGDSGLILALPLSVEEMRMVNEFSLDCGIYKLMNDPASGIMPRLVLLRSCGRRPLDKLSMKLLYQEIKELSRYPDGEIFTVHYRDHDEIGGDL